MIDSAPAPGWWLASDGNWYPPELHPDLRAPSPPEATRINRAREGLRFDAPIAVLERPPAVKALPPETVPPEPVAPEPVAAAVAALAPVTAAPAPVVPESRPAPAAKQPAGRDPRERRRERAEPPPKPRSSKLGLAVTASAATLGFILFQTHRNDNDRGQLDAVPVTTVPATTASASTSAAPSTSAATTAPGAVAPTTTPAANAPAASPTAAPTTGAPTTGAPSTAPVTTGAAARTISVLDLARGQCLDQPDLSTGLLSSVMVVPCNQPHTHEVYYDVKYTESNTFDAAKLSQFANARCVSEFRSYVGVDFEVSRYQYLIIVPTQDTWNRDRDRNVVCVAYDEDGKLSSSIAGSKK